MTDNLEAKEKDKEIGEKSSKPPLWVH